MEIQEPLKKFKSYHYNFFIMGVVMFLLNHFKPRMCDDLGDAKSPMLPYLINRYLTWDGRIVAHFNNTLFANMPKVIFDVVNTFVFLLFIWLVYKHIVGNKKLKDTKMHLLLILIECLIFFLIPVPGQVLLWETGSVAYLWSLVIVLAFLLPFRLYLFPGEYVASAKETILLGLSVLGIFAGNTNENTAGGLIAFELLLVLIRVLQHKRIPPWAITSLLFSMLGFGLLLFAPGNAVRLATYDAKLTASIFANHVEGFLSVLENANQMRFLIILFVAGLVLCYQQKKTKEMFHAALYYFIGFLVAAVMLVLPFYNGFDRSVFGATVFMIIAIGVLIHALWEKEWILNITQIGTAIAACFMVLHIAYAGVALVDLHNQEKTRQAYIQTQASQGNNHVLLPFIHRNYETKYSPFYGLEDLNVDPTWWTNSCYEEYFGVDSVIGMDTARWHHLYEHGDPSLMNIQDANAYIAYLLSNNYDFMLINGTNMSYPWLTKDLVGDVVSKYDNSVHQGAHPNTTVEKDSNKIYIAIGNDEIQEPINSVVVVVFDGIGNVLDYGTIKDSSPTIVRG